MYQSNPRTSGADRAWAVIVLCLFIAVVVSAIFMHTHIDGQNTESDIAVGQSLDP